MYHMCHMYERITSHLKSKFET